MPITSEGNTGTIARPAADVVGDTRADRRRRDTRLGTVEVRRVYDPDDDETVDHPLLVKHAGGEDVLESGDVVRAQLPIASITPIEFSEPMMLGGVQVSPDHPAYQNAKRGFRRDPLVGKVRREQLDPKAPPTNQPRAEEEAAARRADVGRENVRTDLNTGRVNVVGAAAASPTNVAATQGHPAGAGGGQTRTTMKGTEVNPTVAVEKPEERAKETAKE